MPFKPRLIRPLLSVDPVPNATLVRPPSENKIGDAEANNALRDIANKEAHPSYASGAR